jgi:NADH-quinone oxidoreductase subunit M
LVRFSLPFFPAVSMNPKVRGFLIGLSIVGIIYGALVSLMQKDMKKLVAYSSVSHLGFCTLGIFVVNQAGIAGSVLQQINHGMSTGALFLIVGVLYERRHTREISEYGGISNVMPVYATITMIMFLSSMGLPLLNGFIGEFTILQGTFVESKAWAAWAVPGVVLAAAYLLWLYQRVFFGPVTNPKNEKLTDLTPREILTFAPLVALALFIGLYPKPFFQILQQPVAQLVQVVRPELGRPVVVATTPTVTPTAPDSKQVAPPLSRPGEAAPSAVERARQGGEVPYVTPKSAAPKNSKPLPAAVAAVGN